MCRSALAELMRADWRTVGGICARAGASLEEADGRGRFDGLSSIGVDETSHKKGHEYMTVVVGHDRGRVVWACAGHGKRQLNAFLDLLTEGQHAGIEVVTADGARRIADVVAERLPGAELAVDPFHAVSRATGALDELRRRSWREARSRPVPKRRRGRPRKGKQAPPDSAGAPPWRGYLLEEGLRAVFRAGPERAAGELDRWLAWACRCRMPEFVELSRKVRRKRDGILSSIALGVSNARVEAVNSKIRVAIRQGYGFRNTDDLIALIMLRCSDLRPALPGRTAS